MAATILAFPDRGGNGFNIVPSTKLKQLDTTNLIPFAFGLSRAQMDREAAERYPDEKAFMFERTPEMLICMALFKAMPTDQRARAMMAVNETYVRCCDEDSRIAGNILAAISLSDDTSKKERK
jgi:hypothetical protein